QVAGAVVVIVIEPRLADADDAGVRSAAHDLGDGGARLLRLVGMDAHGAEDVVMAMRDVAHGVEFGQPRVDGQHHLNTGGAGARRHVGLVLGEPGVVEMAMAVDQHALRPQACRAAASSVTMRGKMPWGAGSAAPAARRPASPTRLNARASSATAS